MKQRVTIIEKFIELAEHFKELNNFHSLQIVNATLNNASISRLKGEWKEISRKHTNIKKSIETLMSADKYLHSFIKYKKN